MERFLPAVYDAVMHVMPFPCLTRRDGYLNVLSHLPYTPDLQAKGFFGVNKGSGTAWHVDVGDAANIMVAAMPDSKASLCCHDCTGAAVHGLWCAVASDVSMFV